VTFTVDKDNASILKRQINDTTEASVITDEKLRGETKMVKVIDIHTYHSSCIAEWVAEASQIFLPDAHVLPRLLSYEEYCRRDRREADRSISGVSAIDPLVAFYDIHRRKSEELFFSIL
jgi:hypothetical protein